MDMAAHKEMGPLTDSKYCAHTFFRNTSYSPFFLNVCNKLSIADRWVALSGSSEVLKRLRGGGSSSSLGGAPSATSGESICTIMRLVGCRTVLLGRKVQSDEADRALFNRGKLGKIASASVDQKELPHDPIILVIHDINSS